MKAIVVGDNLLPSEKILSRCGPLREAGYEFQAFDWLAPDRNELNRRSLNVERYGPEAEPPPVGLAEAVRDAEILLTHLSPVPRAVVEAGGKLKIIGVTRAGWQHIAVDTATQRGIPVVHIVGRNANAVAEFTLGMILCEMRNIARAHEAMRGGAWYNRMVDPNRCFELGGRTVGLVGFGAVGQVLARQLSGFEVRLLVYDPYVPEATIRAAGGEAVPLEALLRQSDVVSLHARLYPETEGLIGQRELALMKPTAYLVNTARAGLIDQAALVEALQQRRIAGAALDVFWEEPLPSDSALLCLDNMTMTSHVAGTTLDALYYSAELVVEAVMGYLYQGKTDLLINPEVLSNG
ncbi:MAG: 3-phosphoglycerate dehydrogenase [Anaerolineales bacterium]|nr:MAG: 3-phosphoglycerate dehydrogenase [Anaerolineales bacterium]